MLLNRPNEPAGTPAPQHADTPRTCINCDGLGTLPLRGDEPARPCPECHTTGRTHAHTRAELADALFCSPLQPSSEPTAILVRATITHQLVVCRDRCDICMLHVAGECGDHPDLYSDRMPWALDQVDRCYPELSAA